MKRRQAFTLVELVVVIMILGILAGVAAPKLFSTSAEATDNGLRQTLSIVRDAIELYAAEHAGQLPPCTAAPGTDFQTALAPYLRGSFPVCPVGPENSNVEPVSTASPTGNDSATNSWIFSTDDGTFICSSTAATSSDPAVNYDDL